MFPNRLGVTKIMILLNQAVKKRFMLAFPDQTELNGLELFNSGENRCLVDVGFLDFFPLGLPPTSEWFLSWRKCNVALPVKLQHESPANPILECAVGLSPIPFMADSHRQSSTALVRIVGNELTEKANVVGGYGTSTVSELHDHVGDIIDRVMERSLFSAEMIF